MLLALLLLVLDVDAPPSLDAQAERIRGVDTARIEEALGRAGLTLPPVVNITLIANADTRAKPVPSWIVGLASGDRDVVIFPERVVEYPYDSLESVVQHEIVHLALNRAAGGAPLPRWFHEGVATSVESGWNMRARLRLLLAMLARPGIDDLTRLFASSSPAATNDAYLLSALLVHDVRERYGATVPGAIAARVASGADFVQAFRAETGITPDAAAAQAWAGYRRWTAWMPAVASPSTAWAVIILLAGLAFLVQRRRRARRRRAWGDEDEEL